MLTFHTPVAADKEWVAPILASAPSRACEYNFATLCLWADGFQKVIAPLDGRLITRLHQGEQVCFLYPIGTGSVEPAIRAMEEEARACGAPLRLLCLDSSQRQELDAALPGQFSFRENRDDFDYLYTVDKLADLAGRRLHSKRNHIHRFDDNYPDWMFEPLTEGNIPECLVMNQEWYTRRKQEVSPQEQAHLSHEHSAVELALTNLHPLELDGGLIRANGKVLAFALGSRLGPDCFDIHFEKAFGEIQGAYTVVTRELARHVRRRYPDVIWLNREDDVGTEGLRKAKSSYYPDHLLEKYTARLI